MELSEFLRQYGIDFREGGSHRHVRPGWVGVDCPRCGPRSGKFHAGIRSDLTRAACWRCGGFRPFDLLGELTGLRWHEVQALLTPSSGALAGPQTRGRPRGGSEGPGAGRAGQRGLGGARRAKIGPPGALAAPQTAWEPAPGVQIPGGLGTLRTAHKAYLRGRGFDPALVAAQWGVRGTGPVGRLAWRLWIPITLSGWVVSWTTRAIGASEARYVSASPEEEVVSHKTLLYGEDSAGLAIVVVEGPLDVWAVGPGAVATMGLLVTPSQVERIGYHPLRVICFDSESSAQRRARQLAKVLQQYPGETFTVELETGKDAASACPEELVELRRRFLEPLTSGGGPL